MNPGSGLMGPPSERVYHRYVGARSVTGGNKILIKSKIRMRERSEFDSYEKKYRPLSNESLHP